MANQKVTLKDVYDVVNRTDYTIVSSDRLSVFITYKF